MFDNLGLTSKEDVSRDLKRYKIRTDNEAFQKILLIINETMNPFNQDIDQSHLFNVVTGKAAEEETQGFLLSVKDL